MKAVSLFSGAGGMDVGFKQAGFDIIWANDLDKNACKTYERNIGPHIVEGSLDDHIGSLAEVAETNDVSCVFGGPPCQGFSVAGKMDANDPRSRLVWSFMEAVAAIRPKTFVMENVKSLATLEKFRLVRERLFKEGERLGYKVDLVILNSKDYGVPQGRERMFLVGIRGQTNRFRSLIQRQKAPAPPLRDVLLSLGRIGSETNNRVCKAVVTAAAKPVLRKSPYAGMLFNGQGRPLNLDSHATTLPASMGGNRTPIVDDEALYNGEIPWVETYHSGLVNGADPIEWKGVPKRLRRLTIDEAMAIQSFPLDYQFVGPQSSVFKQIGNAVPCGLALSVASAVVEMMAGRATAESDATRGELQFG